MYIPQSPLPDLALAWLGSYPSCHLTEPLDAWLAVPVCNSLL